MCTLEDQMRSLALASGWKACECLGVGRYVKLAPSYVCLASCPRAGSCSSSTSRWCLCPEEANKAVLRRVWPGGRAHEVVDRVIAVRPKLPVLCDAVTNGLSTATFRIA